MLRAAYRKKEWQKSIGRRFLPAMEALERRAMMAALDDDCVMVGGVAVAPEGESGTIQVYSGGPAAPVVALGDLSAGDIGRKADASFDSSLSALSTTSGNVSAIVHSHGILSTSGTQRAAEAQALETSIQSTRLTDIAVSSARSTDTGDSSKDLLSIVRESALLSSAIAVSHTVHDSAVVAGTLAPALAVHTTHSAAPGLPTASAAVSSSGHEHSAVFIPSQHSVEATVTQLEAERSGEPSQVNEKGAGSHHLSGASFVQDGMPTKFAPKQCTEKFTFNELKRTVAGDRRCDCPEKEAAAASARQRDAMDEAITSDAPSIGASFVSLTSRGSDCLPCQRDYFAADGEAQTGVGLLLLQLQNQLLIEDHASESCPAREEVLPSVEEAGAAQFFEGMQLIGFTLLGTSLIAIPWNRKKAKQQQAKAEEFEPAADWLFRRLGFECQPR